MAFLGGERGAPNAPAPSAPDPIFDNPKLLRILSIGGSILERIRPFWGFTWLPFIVIFGAWRSPNFSFADLFIPMLPGPEEALPAV